MKRNIIPAEGPENSLNLLSATKDFSTTLLLTDQRKVVISTEAQRNEEIFEFDFLRTKISRLRSK